ncbi:putative GNAT family acetyltransferase [Bacillus pakistanensis]|uniref:GNAT family acetyltransferase n=1 Tax=Rossellomorea pakistanensis TaxID=992288 RepID=A0ABS2NDV3_9BACI|nr:GNAT family N-acetyltransferase [Bacillus pakistanensis]MBM7586032.1 putative GNAT family acetyltransferase [Bacillus pakistanensis]
MEYLSYSQKRMSAKDIIPLYKDVNWWPERKESDIEKMLQLGSSVGAWKDGRLVGFARAITDGKFRAYIEDVVVISSLQKTGIGKILVAKLLNELNHIDVISLFCSEELIPFYDQNHFKYSKSQFVMHRKN